MAIGELWCQDRLPDSGRFAATTGWRKNMYRMATASLLLVASTAFCSAQEFDTVGMEKSAWGFPEGFVRLSRKLHRSFHYRSRGPMFGGIHGPGWTRSRSTGFIRNHEDVDGLQTDRALVRTARRPNYARGTVDCKVRRARWSRDADARHRSLPAPLNRIGRLSHARSGHGRYSARPADDQARSPECDRIAAAGEVLGQANSR